MFLEHIPHAILIILAKSLTEQENIFSFLNRLKNITINNYYEGRD